MKVILLFFNAYFALEMPIFVQMQHFPTSTCRSKLLFFLVTIMASTLNSQVRVINSQEELAFWLPGKAWPAISFPLQEDWIAASHGHSKVTGHLGSFRLQENAVDVYKFERINDVGTDSDGAAHVGGRLQHGNKSCSFELTARAISPDQIHLSVRVNGGQPFTRLILRYFQPSSAYIFGGGEQFSHLNLQGHRVPMIAEENGIGRGDPKITPFTRLVGVAGDAFSTYCPIPFYMTTEGHGFLVSEGSPLYLDFSQRNRAEVYALEGKLEMEIWQMKAPLDILESYSKINGRFPILPDWAWGTWLGIQGGEERVNQRILQMQKAGCPIAAVWIQDWVGRRDTKFGQRLQWHWEADTVGYPHLKEWIAAQNAQNIRVLGYINPFLKVESPWLDSLIRLRLLVEDSDGKPIKLPVGGFGAYQFELHDPATRAWLAKLIRQNMIDIGFSGWMADFAEWYPAKASLHSKPSLAQTAWIAQHNDYPILWQEVNRMAIESAANSSDFVFFSRSGSIGAGKYTSAYWAGDQMTSWGKNDGLPSALTALISSGMSGMAINHSDIGGYTNVSNPLLTLTRDPELLQRWAEFAAFTPIFRSHEGLLPKSNNQPWGVDGTGHQGFIRMAKLHECLHDYLKAANTEAHENGWPMIRHLWLHYPCDPKVLDLKYEYLLGSDILVIPNISPMPKKHSQVAQISAYFPEGDWQHLIFEDSLVHGPLSRSVQVRLGVPAVYIRDDSPWKESVMAAMRKVFSPNDSLPQSGK